MPEGAEGWEEQPWLRSAPAPAQPDTRVKESSGHLAFIIFLST